MTSIWKTVALLSATIYLAACGSDAKPLLNEGPVNIVFPQGHSATTVDTIKVKGTKTPGVSQLSINGIEADFSQSELFWFADVPLSAQGNTELSLTYEDNDASYEVGTNVTVEKQGLYLQTIGDDSSLEFGNALYVDNRYLDQLWVMDTDGSNMRVLWDYGTASFEGVESFNVEDGMAISVDGVSLYLTAYEYDPETDTDYPFIINLNTATGDTSVLYGPTSNNYQVFNTGHLVLMPSLGEAGQLVLSNTGTNTIPTVFDFATGTMTALDIAALNDLTGGSVYTRIYHMTRESDGVLRLVGNARPSNTYHFWSAQLDLTACDGLDASCTLATEQFKMESTFSGCASPLNNSRLYEGIYHQASQRWVFSVGYSYDQICTMNLQDFTMSSLNFNIAEDTSRNELNLTQNHAYVTLSGYKIVSAELGDTLDNATIEFSTFNDTPNVGDENIQLQTAREVVVNKSRGEVYWLDRDLGVVHKLDLATWQWSTLLEITDEVLEEGDVATRPAFHPEESVLDEANNMLYIISENRYSVFAVNVITGEYQVVLQHQEGGENPHDLYDLDAISLNVEKGILYLANGRKWDEAKLDFTEFNLLAYNIADQSVTEISAATLLADNPLQKDMTRSYDMSYDSIHQRVLFYASGYPLYPMWSVDVNSGERAIVSFDYRDDWDEAECLEKANLELCAKTELIGQPRISNGRGQAMDIANNRLLIASQDSDAILAMDLDSGKITNISPQSFDYGPVFTSPKGITLVEDAGVAFVSDESMDALFLVDTDTGHRVILQNK